MNQVQYKIRVSHVLLVSEDKELCIDVPSEEIFMFLLSFDRGTFVLFFFIGFSLVSGSAFNCC